MELTTPQTLDLARLACCSLCGSVTLLARTHVTRYERVLTMTQWPWSIKDTRKRGGFYGNLGAIRIFAIHRLRSDDNDDQDQFDVFQTNLCRNIYQKLACPALIEKGERSVLARSTFSLHIGKKKKTDKPRLQLRKNAKGLATRSRHCILIISRKACNRGLT